MLRNRFPTCDEKVDLAQANFRKRSMARLIDYLPDADALTVLAAEDLGMILLDLAQGHQGVRFTISDFEMPLWNANVPAYPQHKRIERF
jgi:hypothetical protein